MGVARTEEAPVPVTSLANGRFSDGFRLRVEKEGSRPFVGRSGGTPTFPSEKPADPVPKAALRGSERPLAEARDDVR